MRRPTGMLDPATDSLGMRGQRGALEGRSTTCGTTRWRDVSVPRCWLSRWSPFGRQSVSARSHRPSSGRCDRLAQGLDGGPTATLRGDAAHARAQAAGARAGELRKGRVSVPARPDEAERRAADAARAAGTACEHAPEAYERPAGAHEADARAHDRLAALLDRHGGHDRAAWHRQAAVAALVAARDAHALAAAGRGES